MPIPSWPVLTCLAQVKKISEHSTSKMRPEDTELVRDVRENNMVLKEFLQNSLPPELELVLLQEDQNPQGWKHLASGNDEHRLEDGFLEKPPQRQGEGKGAAR